MLNLANIRDKFPLFRTNKTLVYLDSAATTQKPECTIEAIERFYRSVNANPGRGMYKLAKYTSEHVEFARKKIARFINAEMPEEIVFTHGATDSLNLVANGWCDFLAPGDRVIVSVEEHHSNLLPWIRACEISGAELVKLVPNEEGELTADALQRVLNDRTKIVAVTHISNVLGCVNDIKSLAETTHKAGAWIVVDAAQSVAHIPVDVQDMDCDYLAFSCHKMYGPMGLGILYGKRELLDMLQPRDLGGGMVDSVHWEDTRYRTAPYKFEAGTINAASVYAMTDTLWFIESIGFDAICASERALMSHVLLSFRDIPGITVYGTKDPVKRAGVISFNLDGVHPVDIAEQLDFNNICIRAGQHCAQPLMDHLGIMSAARISFGVYNSFNDVDAFIDVMKTIAKNKEHL